MNTIKTEDALQQVQAQPLQAHQDEPALLEALSIDELAVREEYAACLTITK